ncbi:MAG TPA: class I SAM-dependent methyltransferase [Chitinophagales bacterium]|nr:class I SAM-dependent methyltransferase [Chitinophagales bacterium]
MKDNFSRQSNDYAKFRPHYPKELFDFLIPLVPEHQVAWDVATGNGQVANALADYFEEVKATDISANQLKHAIQKTNIKYSVEPAEHSSFADSTFDLITVAQAIHWFQFDAFYREVRRTLKPHGIIAVIGYPLFTIDNIIDEIILHFYSETLHNCWDPERKYLDEMYSTIPFPFPEIKTPDFSMTYEWTLDELIGFLKTWSAVQHYMSKHHENPVDLVRKDLTAIWKNNEKKPAHFPVILRVGRNT